MKKQIKTLNQLRDSRLLFEKELPPFGYMIFLIVTILLVGIVVWSIYTPKLYMIISKGTITNRDTGYVMATYTGEIEKSYMEEGKPVQQGDVLFVIRSTDYNLQKEQLLASKGIYERQIEQLQLLVESIKDNQNYFDAAEKEEQLYYSTYEAYQNQIAQNVFDASTYISYGYTEEQIERELAKNQEKRAEIYYTAIQSAEKSIKDAQLQIASIEAQIVAVSDGQADYIVKANNSGVLHMLADYSEGMVVQTGTAVATITPENAEIVVEGFVSTADMSRIEEGDTVQISVDGLLQSVYGNISGTVISIDSNLTTMDNQQGQSEPIFKIRIEPNSDYIISKAGRKVNLTNGMTVEARITYDEVTYFNYALEKLGLLIR